MTQCAYLLEVVVGELTITHHHNHHHHPPSESPTIYIKVDGGPSLLIPFLATAFTTTPGQYDTPHLHYAYHRGKSSLFSSSSNLLKKGRATVEVLSCGSVLGRCYAPLIPEDENSMRLTLRGKLTLLRGEGEPAGTVTLSISVKNLGKVVSVMPSGVNKGKIDIKNTGHTATGVPSTYEESFNILQDAGNPPSPPPPLPYQYLTPSEKIALKIASRQSPREAFLQEWEPGNLKEEALGSLVQPPAILYSSRDREGARRWEEEMRRLTENGRREEEEEVDRGIQAGDSHNTHTDSHNRPHNRHTDSHNRPHNRHTDSHNRPLDRHTDSHNRPLDRHTDSHNRSLNRHTDSSDSHPKQVQKGDRYNIANNTYTSSTDSHLEQIQTQDSQNSTHSRQTDSQQSYNSHHRQKQNVHPHKSAHRLDLQNRLHPLSIARPRGWLRSTPPAKAYALTPPPRFNRSHLLRLASTDPLIEADLKAEVDKRVKDQVRRLEVDFLKRMKELRVVRMRRNATTTHHHHHPHHHQQRESVGCQTEGVELSRVPSSPPPPSPSSSSPSSSSPSSSSVQFISPDCQHHSHSPPPPPSPPEQVTTTSTHHHHQNKVTHTQTPTTTLTTTTTTTTPNPRQPPLTTTTTTTTTRGAIRVPSARVKLGDIPKNVTYVITSGGEREYEDGTVLALKEEEEGREEEEEEEGGGGGKQRREKHTDRLVEEREKKGKGREKEEGRGVRDKEAFDRRERKEQGGKEGGREKEVREGERENKKTIKRREKHKDRSRGRRDEEETKQKNTDQKHTSSSSSSSSSSSKARHMTLPKHYQGSSLQGERTGQPLREPSQDTWGLTYTIKAAEHKHSTSLHHSTPSTHLTTPHTSNSGGKGGDGDDVYTSSPAEELEEEVEEVSPSSRSAQVCQEIFKGRKADRLSGLATSSPPESLSFGSSLLTPSRSTDTDHPLRHPTNLTPTPRPSTPQPQRRSSAYRREYCARGVYSFTSSVETEGERENPSASTPSNPPRRTISASGSGTELTEESISDVSMKIAALLVAKKVTMPRLNTESVSSYVPSEQLGTLSSMSDLHVSPSSSFSVSG